VVVVARESGAVAVTVEKAKLKSVAGDVGKGQRHEGVIAVDMSRMRARLHTGSRGSRGVAVAAVAIATA